MESLDWMAIGALAAIVALICAVWRQLRLRRAKQVQWLVLTHLGRPAFPELAIASREFPYRCRADLQRSLDELFRELEPRDLQFFGLPANHCGETVSLRESLCAEGSTHWIAAPEYEEIDIGEAAPVRCVKNGLWLVKDRAGIRYALLIGAVHHYRPDPVAVRMQVAHREDSASRAAAGKFFARLESSVARAESYRGKILSLECSVTSYTGQGCGVKVHKLDPTPRDGVVLPAATLELLDRNVLDFVRRRPGLRRLGQSTRKGLLFYGPPGVGKTHTIRYLAQALPGHTTLLISGEQVGQLDEYMTLARLLQPSLVVLEDVDLIARSREQMGNACQESMLNKLLNHMDGLQPQADVMFILTTNRPEALEAALSSRPGRVDQAIEFPLPDAACRRKLARMYARQAFLDDEVVERIVDRTERMCAAFIKELMRRAAQYSLERHGSCEAAPADGCLPALDRPSGHCATDGPAAPTPPADRDAPILLGDVDNAIDDLILRGGSLNLKMLGATVAWDRESDTDGAMSTALSTVA